MNSLLTESKLTIKNGGQKIQNTQIGQKVRKLVQGHK